MAPSRTARSSREHRTAALLLHQSLFRESDLVVALFTQSLGSVKAVARGGRRSAKRFGGALEPIHTIEVRLSEHASSELMILDEASLKYIRRRIVRSLDHMSAAGRALGWLRRALPAHVPEPELWLSFERLLDELDAQPDATGALARVAEVGLSLLATLGWGLDFMQCIRCGRRCMPEKKAQIDARRGGLVCRSCGGARITLEGRQRLRMAAASRGEALCLQPEDAPLALDLVELALAAHIQQPA